MPMPASALPMVWTFASRVRPDRISLPMTTTAALADVQAAHPGLDVGSYPFASDGRFGTSLVARGADAAAVAVAAGEIAAFLAARGVSHDIDGVPPAA